MSAARIVFVTGLSGAGKSQAIKTFEDLGFYCVEHLPPAALDATLRVLDAGRVGDIAITLQEHGDALLGDALATIETAARTRPVDVLYLEPATMRWCAASARRAGAIRSNRTGRCAKRSPPNAKRFCRCVSGLR